MRPRNTPKNCASTYIFSNKENIYNLVVGWLLQRYRERSTGEKHVCLFGISSLLRGVKPETHVRHVCNVFAEAFAQKDKRHSFQYTWHFSVFFL